MRTKTSADRIAYPPAELPRRLIGRFEGAERGPLLVAVGGMHGNEPAGVRAIERLLEMLAFERTFKPGFAFRGRFVGFRGNVRALAAGRRFLRRDLNRHFDAARMERDAQRDVLSAEDAEALELGEAIQAEVRDYDPAYVVFIDLHTTTADGGIFSIVTDDPGSRAIAQDIHAPAIVGLLEGMHDTSLHHFTSERLGKPTTAFVFESGQHQDPLSVDRAVSALVHALRSIGAVHPRDVEGKHDDILVRAAEGLPKLVRYRYAHHITARDRFVMRPGYHNFMPIAKGEHLADDASGPVRSPMDGLILMPLYQAQGEDGFFIVEEI